MQFRSREASGEWALVRVHASALCTEYKAYLAGRASSWLGHEGVGEVVAVGCEGPVKAGDRVVMLPQFACGQCRHCESGDYIYCEHEYDFEKVFGTSAGIGTFAEYALKRVHLLPKIPASVTYEQATMAVDGIGASFGGLQAISVGACETLLVCGLGAVGLGAVVNARYRNTRVIGVEPSQWRRKRALEMGAELVFDASEEDLVVKITKAT